MAILIFRFIDDDVVFSVGTLKLESSVLIVLSEYSGLINNFYWLHV